MIISLYTKLKCSFVCTVNINLLHLLAVILVARIVDFLASCVAIALTFRKDVERRRDKVSDVKITARMVNKTFVCANLSILVYLRLFSDAAASYCYCCSFVWSVTSHTDIYSARGNKCRDRYLLVFPCFRHFGNEEYELQKKERPAGLLKRL